MDPDFLGDWERYSRNEVSEDCKTYKVEKWKYRVERRH